MPKRPCLTCGKLVAGSYCKPHDPKPKRYREKRGSGWAQSRFRAAVLRRARGRCEGCGQAGVALEAHHIRPVSAGGTHHPSNGAALCDVCHPKETRRAR
jgi:5-methylcytosine-specific restriction endonuclease McrA